VFEILLLLTAAGLVLACDPRLGFGNPFQIYFLTWLPVLIAFFIFRETFIAISNEYLLLVLTAKAVALLLTLVARVQSSNHASVGSYASLNLRTNLIAVAQLLVCLAAPFAYLRAKELAGGEDIFTVVGYIALRSTMTEDGGQIGLLAYFSVLSYSVTSLTLLAYKKNAASFFRLMFSLAISLFYVYLSTGRTSLLLLFSLTLMPLIMLGAIRMKGVLIGFFLVAATFVFAAGMTAKGVSVDSGFSENTASLIENLRAYTVAPFLAMSKLVESDRALEWGANTFRFPLSVMYATGLTDQSPPALIRDYAFVPDPTNVYTVYDVYFRDFSYPGMLIPPALLAFHWWLYRQARRTGGKWIFYYAASACPLAMQFFQELYFSMLSIWIQTGFWFWIFLLPEKKIRENLQLHHA
jgi:oligosaccharide repeat unit polymerase